MKTNKAFEKFKISREIKFQKELQKAMIDFKKAEQRIESSKQKIKDLKSMTLADYKIEKQQIKLEL
jgi:hypothetical protein